MALRASDLSYGDRWQFLCQLKSQTGEATYDELVRTHGDEGLLDRALRAAENALSQPRRCPPAGCSGDCLP